VLLTRFHPLGRDRPQLAGQVELRPHCACDFLGPGCVQDAKASLNLTAGFNVL